MDNRIVVTGMGIISSAGLDKKAFWNSLCQGRSGIKAVTGFDSENFSAHKAGQITDFKARNYIQRKSIRNLDRVTRFVLAAGKLALEDSKLEITPGLSLKTGIVLGSMYGGWSSTAEFHRQMLEYKAKRVNPLLFPNTVLNVAAGQLAIELGVRGLNNSLSTGFASSIDSIGWGVNYLRYNKANIILAGGIEELSVWSMGSFDKLGYLAYSTEQREENCRPFDLNRNGMILGEGSGVLILETLADAKKREAPLYGEIIGYGSAYDSGDIKNALKTAIVSALEEAQLSPDKIDYINAEGNSMPESDKVESCAFEEIFGFQKPISSIKPITGHCLGSSGAFDVIACILALKNQTLPPTVNYQTPDPECKLDYIPNKPREEKLNICLSVSLDPQGNSSCIIIKKV